MMWCWRKATGFWRCSNAMGKIRFWSLSKVHCYSQATVFRKEKWGGSYWLGPLGQRCFQTVDNLYPFNHFDIRVKAGLVNWRHYKNLPAKTVAMAPKTTTKTDLKECCREIGKWYNDVKYHKLQEMSRLLRWVCLSLVFVAREFVSHNWWDRNSSLCARQWLRGGLLHTTLHVRHSLCDTTWRLGYQDYKDRHSMRNKTP